MTKDHPVSSANAVSIPEANWPWFDYVDGYPEDEEFQAFDNLPLDWFRGAHWLARELPRAAEHMPCFCEVTQGQNAIRGEVTRIEFSTGGWSGAESLIGLIKRRPDLGWKFHESWKRGGHYVFEIEPIYLRYQSYEECRAAQWDRSGEAGESPVGRKADAPEKSSTHGRMGRASDGCEG